MGASGSSYLVGKIAVPGPVSDRYAARGPRDSNNISRVVDHVSSGFVQPALWGVCGRDSSVRPLRYGISGNRHLLHGRANLLAFEQASVTMAALPNPSLLRDRLSVAPHVRR